MNGALLALYHRAPSPLKSAAATTRGLYLKSVRYGAETDALVDRALEADTAPREASAARREDTLARFLARAAARVPYYREHFAERRRRGERPRVEDLSSWPLLTKDVVRARALELLADDADPRALWRERTSGTTGTPLTVFLSRDAVRAWYALFEARVRRWNGVSRRDRWANLGGQLVAPVDRARPPFWVWNAGLAQLYMSSYHLAPGRASGYVAALRERRVRYLHGYASSLESLAFLGAEEGLESPRPTVALSNAEPLSARARARIEAFFGCPVRDTYGMAEIAAAASECAEGELHLWPEVGALEVLSWDSDAPVPRGEPGRLVATGLLNAAMPLVRYVLGDGGALADDRRCACGRTLPRLKSLEGREDDLVVTPDGARVGRLDPVFKADLPIREAQIVQEARDQLVVKVVPVRPLSGDEREDLAARVKERVGSRVAVLVEEVASLPRGANGKLRAVVSKVRA
jgi:phenylacetate-coenzyme A ligase PaaK-like adenylate-forming protein